MTKESGEREVSIKNGFQTIIKKIKDKLVGFGGVGKEQKPSFDPTELFLLFASTGPEGQQPLQTFEEGSTLVFERSSPFFATKTIFREEIIDLEEGISYFFWCVGDYQSDGSVTLYNAHSNSLNWQSPYLGYVEDLGAIVRHIKPNHKGKIEYAIGDEGVMIDFWFLSRAGFRVENLEDRFIRMRKSRLTRKIDIMQMGQVEKQKVPIEYRRGVTVLKPQPIPVR